MCVLGGDMKYDVERSAILLSVVELCAHAFLPSHLDLRPGAWRRSLERAERGKAAHKSLRSSQGAGYQAEVPLCNTTLYEGICYEVSGRADGVIREGDRVIVEEIKTVGKRAFGGIPSASHEAQAMCYAYFLCRQEELSFVEVRLTLCRAEDQKTRCFARTCSAEELSDFYLSMLSKVAFRANFLRDRLLSRLPSVHSGRFPYPSVREGQDIMLRECYRAIRGGKRLFVEAPTGTGKTVSSLYPAVRALGEGYCDKIFYLTAKASTRREAYGASAAIYEAGSRLRTIVLSSREHVCANARAKSDPAGISRHCNPQDCPRAVNFYEKCRRAIEYLLEQQSGFPRQSIEEIAERFEICPHEFQLELSEFCDIVICDYNYVFDPIVHLRRYFDADCDDRYVFLVDEAHNLVDRACDMYTAEMKLSQLSAAYILVSSLDENWEKQFEPLERLIVAVQGCKRLCSDTLLTDDEGVEHGYYLNSQQMILLDREVNACISCLEKWVHAHQGEAGEAELSSLLSTLKRCQMVSEAYDSHFTTFVEVEGEEITVRQICRDASLLLDAVMNRAKSTVLFSATLTPLDYFVDILGGGKGAKRLSLPSPFDPAKTCLVTATGVSTRYGDREKSAKKIASLIAATVSGKRGNYIFYFPSYDYMEQVYDIFTEKWQKVQTVKQERGMTLRAREAFLDSFTDSGGLRVGFCVLGGSFSEGVDLPGKRLIGVGIVGVGLPGLSSERNLLKEYYDDTRESGYDYAYTYPGMNRVLQAAGRVIRRESDCGVIVLIDDRYATPQYKSLFPDHWLHAKSAINAAELANIVSDFWKKFDV